MPDRRKAAEAVLIAIVQDDKVLLHKRKNTGWMDDYYDVPSGHVDPHETIIDAAIREVREEVGLEVSGNDLELYHISQSDITDLPYTYFIFRVRRWHGTPTLNEPNMAEDLSFQPLDHLPKKSLTTQRLAY
jgi:8-oxo-dGTP diphosphatase